MLKNGGRKKFKKLKAWVRITHASSVAGKGIQKFVHVIETRV